jgi:hypothetical protein
VLAERPAGALRNDAAAKALLRWAAAEREAWLDAVTNPESFRGCCRTGYCRRIIWGNRHGGRPQGPAAGGSAARRRPATACPALAMRRRTHIQPRKNRRSPRVTQDNLLLHMQHEVGQGNRPAIG